MLMGELRELLGYRTSIEIKIVEKIDPLKSGKRPYIINNYLRSQINAN